MIAPINPYQSLMQANIRSSDQKVRGQCVRLHRWDRGGSVGTAGQMTKIGWNRGWSARALVEDSIQEGVEVTKEVSKSGYLVPEESVVNTHFPSRET